MAVRIFVDAYSGYKANERPRQFTLDEAIYEIAAVLDQWYEPAATYFKVQSTEGKTYLLRYDVSNDEWSLQSGFDGDELLARPSKGIVEFALRGCGRNSPNNWFHFSLPLNHFQLITDNASRIPRIAPRRMKPGPKFVIRIII